MQRGNPYYNQIQRAQEINHTPIHSKPLGFSTTGGKVIDPFWVDPKELIAKKIFDHLWLEDEVQIQNGKVLYANIAMAVLLMLLASFKGIVREYLIVQLLLSFFF